jgi:hypothetical protein
MKNRSKILVAILPVLACFAFLPGARAVCLDGCGPMNSFNTFQGDDALRDVTIGGGNSAFGWRALIFDTTGNFNTGLGGGALAFNNADSNTAVGAAAMLFNTGGTLNTAVGTDAMVFNDSGGNNNAVGAFALFLNFDGFFNNAHGNTALTNNVSGGQNNAFGDRALRDSTGGGNSAFGDDALLLNTGSLNTAVGNNAGASITTGGNNTCVGNNAGNGISTANNQVAIGVAAAGPFANISNTCFIRSIFAQPLSAPPGQDIGVDSNNVIGMFVSSRRFKHDIHAMDKTSETLYKFKPVTFKYNADKSGTTQYGLIAEDVAEVAPELVSRDENGKVLTVSLRQINVMLLNEFLKEHKKVEEQQASISQLKSEMQTMVAQLKE